MLRPPPNCGDSGKTHVCISLAKAFASKFLAKYANEVFGEAVYLHNWLSLGTTITKNITYIFFVD